MSQPGFGLLRLYWYWDGFVCFGLRQKLASDRYRTIEIERVLSICRARGAFIPAFLAQLTQLASARTPLGEAPPTRRITCCEPDENDPMVVRAQRDSGRSQAAGRDRALCR